MNTRIVVAILSLAVLSGCANVVGVLERGQRINAERAGDPEWKYMDPNWHYHAFPTDDDYRIAQCIGN